jgi:GNAT superfamily N-acetyltransferase
MTLSTTTTPMSTDWFVRKTTEDDLPAITDTLVAAFWDDPAFSWWVQDEQRRAEIFPRFFGLMAEVHMPLGTLDATDEVNGCAIWVPPGGQPTAEEMAELIPRLAEATEEYAEVLLEVLERMEAVHPTEPHWYLFFLATRPEWQSRGMGSALMRAVLKECDAQQLPAYLEASSERSKQLYLRHGFEVTGEVPLDDGVSLWPMWREPRTRQNP